MANSSRKHFIAATEHFASRQNNARSTSVATMTNVLTKNGLTVNRHDVILVLKELAECGAGIFVLGRHRHQTRLVWTDRGSKESCELLRDLCA